MLNETEKHIIAKWSKRHDIVHHVWNKGIIAVMVLAGICSILGILKLIAPIWVVLSWASCFIYNELCFALATLCIEMKYPCNLGTNEPNFRYHETWKSGCKVVLKDMIKTAPTKILPFFISICLLAFMYFSLTIDFN